MTRLIGPSLISLLAALPVAAQGPAPEVIGKQVRIEAGCVDSVGQAVPCPHGKARRQIGILESAGDTLRLRDEPSGARFTVPLSEVTQMWVRSRPVGEVIGAGFLGAIAGMGTMAIAVALAPCFGEPCEKTGQTQAVVVGGLIGMSSGIILMLVKPGWKEITFRLPH